MTRDQILTRCDQLASMVWEPIAVQMAEAASRGDKERMAELDREGKRAYAMATAPLVRLLAMLPPDPIIIPKP